MNVLRERERQTERERERETERERQTDRQRQTERQTDRAQKQQTTNCLYFILFIPEGMN